MFNSESENYTIALLCLHCKCSSISTLVDLKKKKRNIINKTKFELKQSYTVFALALKCN
jgi:hypothetical protein